MPYAFILVGHKGLLLNNVQWHTNVGNSHYEKFADGTVKCIDDEIPFEIPQGWEWARLGSIVDFSTNASVKSESIEPNSWLLDLEDIEKDSGKLLIKKRMRDVNSKSHKHPFHSGNVLYSKLRPYLNKVILADEDGYCTTEILAFDFGYLYNAYAQLFLMSPFFVEYAMRDAYGVKMPRLGSKQGNSALMPIPPLQEQKRIVQKFRLLSPFIEKYANAQDALDLLNDNIKDSLKKSVLQDAIQGRLVSQDPNDEPASVLIDRIRAEKQKLLKEGKIKKKDIIDSVIFKGEDNKYYERIGTEVAEIEVPFQFPESWAIVRLQTICTLADGERRTGDGICLDAKYLRGKSAGDHLQSGKYVHAGDNIILVDGENSGEVFTVPINGYMGSTFKRLWVSKKLHLPYVLSCIRFYKDELRNSKKGAAIPHLNKDIFRNLIIGIPPSKEQKSIMAKLTDICGKL